MNVPHYFIGSPSFSEPPILIHTSAVPDAPSPDELAALLDLWQNPLYPEDSYFTQDQFDTEARTKSMQRAQSPAVLLCQVDLDITKNPPVHVPVDNFTHPLHGHTYSECMAYRAQNIIAPSDPWTYWMEYDTFPFAPPPITPTPPPQPHGWNPLTRVNPRGISQMTGWSWSWTGFSFAVQIGASQFFLMSGYGPGTQTRVTIAAAAIFGSLYIGPATSRPFVASALYRMTFGGQNTNINIDGPTSDGVVTNFPSRTCDPIPHALDFSNGVIICGYVSGRMAPYGPTSYLAVPSQQLDWAARYAAGDFAAALDKSKWTVGSYNDLGVYQIDGYYP